MFIVYGKAIDYVIGFISFIGGIETIKDFINGKIEYIFIYLIIYILWTLIKNNKSRNYLLKRLGISIVFILKKIAKLYGLLSK